jgi:predicted N-acetyltransferase YhbS
MPSASKYDKVLALLIKQGYTFSFLTADDIPLHHAFVQRNWPGAITRGNFEYNKWKLGEREDGSINLLVCKKDGNIIGQIAYVSQQIVINKEIHDCYWGCNFMVDAEYKGIGIGAALEIYAKQYYPIILGNSPTTDSLKYKKQLGFKNIEGATTMMLPFKADHFVRLKLHNLNHGLKGLVSSAINPFLSIYWNIKLSSASTKAWQQTTIEEVKSLIANKQQAMSIPYILHDNSFLNWRLNMSEQFRQSEPNVLVSENKSSYLIYKRNGNIISIYDFHFPSQQELKSVLKYLHQTESGITTIKLFANNNQEEILFKKNGFFSFKTKGVVTAYSEKGLFDSFSKMHVDIIDGDGDI